MVDGIRYYYGELQRSYGRSRYRRLSCNVNQTIIKPLSPCNYEMSRRTNGRFGMECGGVHVVYYRVFALYIAVESHRRTAKCCDREVRV